MMSINYMSMPSEIFATIFGGCNVSALCTMFLPTFAVHAYLYNRDRQDPRPHNINSLCMQFSFHCFLHTTHYCSEFETLSRERTPHTIAQDFGRSNALRNSLLGVRSPLRTIFIFLKFLFFAKSCASFISALVGTVTPRLGPRQ